jgi:hypothetical protein
MRGELGEIGKKKEPATALQLTARLHERFHALATGGYCEDSEAVETENGSVNALSPGGFVGQQFAVKGALREVLPHDWHGGAVSFQEKVGAIAVGGLQSKNTIRDYSQFKPTAHIDTPLEGVAALMNISRWFQLLGGEETNLAILATGQFKGDHDITDEQGVFEKETAGTLVFWPPIKLVEGQCHLPLEKCRTPVSQAINHAAGTAAPVVVVNLSVGPFEIPVMVKQLQTPEDLLRT